MGDAATPPHATPTADEMFHMEHLATMGRCAGMLAHELNNILTPMLSYAQAALDAPAQSPLREKALRRAAEGAERAAHLVSALLGDLDPTDEARLAPVAEIVTRAAGAMPRPLERDGLRLENRVPSGLRAAIAPTALQHVVLNLLLNAQEACGRGNTGRQGGSVIVEAGCSTWNGKAAVRIVVRDSGPGVPGALRDRLFDAFVRAEPGRGSACSQSLGLGLGLTLCRTLLERAGGQIRLAEPGTGGGAGGGAAFEILVPAAGDSARASPSRAA